ncbi:MAG: SLBB domain-containing protein [Rhodocyclaceae bacterium]
MRTLTGLVPILRWLFGFIALCVVDAAVAQGGGFLQPRAGTAPMASPAAANGIPPELQDAYRRYAAQPLAPSEPPQRPAAAAPVAPAAAAFPKPEPNEFQLFAAQSTGRELPLFGQNLFAEVPSTFAPVENVPVTSDYVIGPGDELLVRVWGQVDGDFRALVDRNGTVALPRVGVFNVAGVRYQDLHAFLRNAIGRLYKNFDLSVSLGQLRSIQILVVGQARRPGSYTVSSLSTLVNALFAAGGPSAKGSMRRIQLKRGDAVVTEFDLYDLLLKGDKSKDARLLPGDVIFIPPVGALVAVSGSVNVPAVFELRGGAATLGEVIGWAGGLATTASGQRAVVERIEDRKARRVDEFALGPEGLARTLRDGDVVRVFALTPRFDAAVTLRGFVAEPARHPWRPGMRVRDLIPSRQALVSRDFWRARNRTEKADIGGEAQLRNEVSRAEEVNWDYAVIERLKEDLTTDLLPFNLGRAVLEADPAQNLELRGGDIVTVFSKKDIDVPVASQARYVRLEGELSTAGVYKVMPGETLRQLVARVGGLTPQAYLYGAEFTRESTRQAQQKQLDQALNRLELEARRVAVERAQAITTPEDAQAARREAEAQQALIAKLRAVKASGRIVLDVPAQGRGLADLPDLALEDGDRLFVPPRPSVVSVFGAVFNQNAFVHREDKRVSDYLAQAGGLTRDADTGQLYVLRADGSVLSKENRGWLSLEGERLMPGDAVIVPERLEKFVLVRELKDWAQVFYQFALGVAGLKVLRSL